MNSAMMKWNIFLQVSGKYKGLITNIEYEILAMLANKKRKPIAPSDINRHDTTIRYESFPFLTHYQNADKVKYKAGYKR